MRAKQIKSLDNQRRRIAAKVRELRRSRKWTQAELSAQLHLSQNYLSEIERGSGSFTAEQFLLLLKLFNVPVSQFVSEPGDQDLRIQNALARLGAPHLQESDVLPGEQLEEVHDVMREALVDGSARFVTALAPVLVRNVEHLNLIKLHAELEKLGLERRLVWVVENTLTALGQLHKEAAARSREWAKLDRRAEVILQAFLEFVTAQGRLQESTELPPDVLDAAIRSTRTLDEVRSSASDISKRWGIISSLQVKDFLQALKAARAAH
jgi:transcriptional regulator with XRE-family HTH domain